jgi:hypothetical protein
MVTWNSNSRARISMYHNRPWHLTTCSKWNISWRVIYVGDVQMDHINILKTSVAHAKQGLQYKYLTSGTYSLMCMFCRSLFFLTYFFRLAVVFVLLRCTDSDYPFGNFKLLLDWWWWHTWGSGRTFTLIHCTYFANTFCPRAFNYRFIM